MLIMKGFLLLIVPGQAQSGLLTGDMTFTMTEANKLARLTQLSYCEPESSPDVLDWSCETCIESGVSVVPGSVRFVHGDQSNNSQALVGKLAKQPGCFVAFRGSHTAQNWIKDFQTWFYDSELSEYPDCTGCKVHYGFYTFWENLRDDVNVALDQVGCKDEQGDPVFITGHSLGGALAHLAAFTLQNRGYKVSTMYSFEAPRVGNDKFAARYNAIFGSEAPCYRITHDHDPIVHGPPEFLGFIHVNTEVYFKEKGSDYTVLEKTEDPHGANQNSNVLWDLAYTGEHCGLPAFGNGFDICTPACNKPKVESVVV